MDASTIRLIFSLSGLFTFLSWELAAPHHKPTVPRARRWFNNLTLAAVNGVMVGAVCTLCYKLAEGRDYTLLLRMVELPALPRIVLEVVLLDLVTYVLHHIYHRVDILWRLHQVHHIDLDLDVTSASRFHALEVLSSAGIKFAVVLLLGISPTGLLASEIALLLAAQFQHANIRLPKWLDAALWWSFVPPSMHRIHHRPTYADTNSNYGTVLTIWDRIFRSMRRDAIETVTFGDPAFKSQTDARWRSLIGWPFTKH